MPAKIPIPTLEEDERRARIRLQAFRARLFRRDYMSPMGADMRLRELERKWKGAADRLRRARRGGV